MITFKIDNINTQTNQTLSIPVKVTDFNSVSTVQFTIAWDPAVLQLQGVSNFGLPGLSNGNFGQFPPNGKLTFSWDDPNGGTSSVANNTTIFAIDVSVSGSAATNTNLAFGNNPTVREVTVNWEVVGVAYQDGSVSVN